MNGYFLKVVVTAVLYGCCLSAMAAKEFVLMYKLTDAQRAFLETYNGVNAQARQAEDQIRKELMAKLSTEQLERLSVVVAKVTSKIPGGIRMTDSDALTNGAHIITLDEDLDARQTKQFLEAIAQREDVEFVVENQKLVPSSGPSINSQYQWDMAAQGEFSNKPEWHGDNFARAWALLKSRNYVPGENVVVAVLDTGYTPHPNFINNLQPLNEQAGEQAEVYGYNFISDCRMSGECSPSTTSRAATKSRYTPDGLDLGDFIDDEDIRCSFFRGNGKKPSSWHGSHVIGTIASNRYGADDLDNITGGAPGVTVVPVRVLGKGGGRIEDIIDGMRWAAGLEVDNLDGSSTLSNPKPAQIINLSLGGSGPCSAKFQQAVNDVIAAGVTVVVAAGNENKDVKDTYPANCRGVISVAARGPTGKLAPYSNFGNTTITASGGDRTITGLLSMVRSTVWSSLGKYQSSAEGGDGSWKEMQGTSMATPHVSAAIAILISILKVNAINTLNTQGESFYTRDKIISLLRESSIKYDRCNKNGCATEHALDVERLVRLVLGLGLGPDNPFPEKRPQTDALNEAAKVTSNVASYMVPGIIALAGGLAAYLYMQQPASPSIDN